MSIKSGQRYKIKNEENGLVLDLYDTHDNSIIAHAFHGAGIQQWIIVKQEDGQWTIQSVSGQRYIGFKNTPKDGTLIFGCEKPQLWDIEVLSDSDAYDNPRVKFWVRGTLLVVESPEKKLHPVQLRAAWEGRNQVWVVEEYS